MWEWREDTTRGGWRLDAYGTWTWEEGSPLSRFDAGPSALRGAERRQPAMAGLPDARREVRPGRERPLYAVPEPARPVRQDIDATPIFRAVATDRERRRHEWEDRGRPTRWDDAYEAPFVPEPHPGSGALPVQRPEDVRRADVTRRRGLAAVDAVPPPPPGGVVTAEDEVRRRAERRRRPQAVESTPAHGGRHALLPREEPSGRHVLRR